MASLALTSPPAVKVPSYLASSSSSLFSRSSISFSTIESRSRICVSNSAKCNLPKALNLGNGKASIPITNGTTLPNYFDSSSRLEKPVSSSSRAANTKLKLFSGTANPALSQEIAWYMGLELGKISIKRFADGEVYVQLKESVRGCDVFLVQPTCTPTNENLMELLIMTQGRESIAAKLVANLITEAGADRVLACDLHSGQSMGYFDIPVDHVYCQPVILDYLASKSISSQDLVVVSPDVGGVARARAFAKKLSDAPLAIVDKRRHGHNVAEVKTFTSFCLSNDSLPPRK
ncbi:hypothetical protein Bca52824_013737 [Brassica carinata]|uniref:ribose-phosphate diphosphokinase n=1 Tax=Brassica carinata TaxID=52824 RepID=A0A8X7VZP1_BRACI|nr:hypothetical protein Bca52824_013737 [Brassica carinata]